MENIALKHIEVKIGGKHILEDINVNLQSGQVFMLAGPNGAGKSTLLDLFLGMVKPSSGKIFIDNREGIDNEFKMGMGYLPENLCFVDALTGRQILAFFAKVKRVSDKRVSDVLTLTGLEHAANKATRHYSSGMKQRLGLGIAILNEPKFLVLDEPTTALDQEGLQLLFSILEEWQRKKRIVLLATHDLTMLEKRVTHMCVMNEGKTKTIDTPAKLRLEQDIPYRMSVSFKPALNKHEYFTKSLDALGNVNYQLHNHHLYIDSDQYQLSQLISLWHQYSDNIATFSIAEPSLNDVYEQILKR